MALALYAKYLLCFQIFIFLTLYTKNARTAFIYSKGDNDLELKTVFDS